MRCTMRTLAAMLFGFSSLAFSFQAGAPVFQANPATVDCGTTMTGGLMHNNQLTISNTGTAPLNISSVTVTGSEFFVNTVTSGPIPTTVQPGQSTLTFTLVFTPSASGLRTGQMVVQDDAAGSPHTIQLTGFAVDVAPGDFAVLAPNNAPATATVTAGQTAAFNLVATGASNTIKLSCSGAPRGAVCSPPPSVGLANASILGSNSSENVTVQVSTTAATASLRLPGAGLWCSLVFSAGLIIRRGGKRGATGVVLAFCAISILAGMISCGGGGGNTGPTPPGTYSLSLTAVGGGGAGPTHTVPLTLVVK